MFVQLTFYLYNHEARNVLKEWAILQSVCVTGLNAAMFILFSL